MTSNDNISDNAKYSSLCPTAKIVAATLDGATERAILLTDDGFVVHMNASASHFLNASEHVSDFLHFDDPNCDWRRLERSRVKMANEKTTRTHRNLHITKLEPCPCCQPQSTYYSMFICSKHERVREVVDHAFDPVFTVNEAGMIITVNEAACETFGYPEAELVGRDVSMLCGGGHGPNHAQYMKNYKETGIPKILGTVRETFGKKKDGTEFPCQLGIQKITDASSGKVYYCGFFKDLTQIKQHEAEKEEFLALLQGMIDCSFDPMFEIDEVGIIKIVNDAACQMFGYKRDEFLGSNISLICGDGHAEKHASYMDRYQKTGEKRIIGRKRQVKARRKDGSELLVELGVQEVHLASSGKKSYCGYIRDLTEKQKDKRALRKQQQMIHNKFFGVEAEASTDASTDGNNDSA